MASTAPEENNKWVPNSYDRTLLRLAFERGGAEAEQKERDRMERQHTHHHSAEGMAEWKYRLDRQVLMDEKNAVCMSTSSEETASAEQADSTRFDLENLICQGLSPTARAPHKFVASQSHPTYYCAKCGFTANNKRFHI